VPNANGGELSWGPEGTTLYFVTGQRTDGTGTVFVLTGPDGVPVAGRCPLPGDFNVANTAVALLTLVCDGVAPVPVAELDDARCRLENRAGDLSRAARRRLEAVRSKLSPAGVAASASRARARLEVGGAALETAARARLDDARRRLGLAVASLDAMSPLAVLGRGYALATDEGGRVLRSTRGVSEGDTLRVRLAEGSLRCRVEEAEGN